MDSDNLVLSDEQGHRTKIAEFILGKPIDEDGFKYQTITLTIRFTTAFKLGNKLTVTDATSDQQIVTFMPERIVMFMKGEAFNKIEGRKILALKP